MWMQILLRVLKFIYSEKATKFCKIFTLLLTNTDTPYRQDPNLGGDKGGLLGSKKDKYKVCSLLNKAQPNFGSSAAWT